MSDGQKEKKVRAKKSLGQHFLTSRGVVDRMIETADVKAGEMILEIGPGKGVLTEGLLKRGAHVVAVEKDADMITILEEKFKDEIASCQLTLVNTDILKFVFEQKKYKLIANIPYYITGAIIRQFLEATDQPQSMTLLVQKEVAERIVAKDKKESLLSISVKAYGTPSYIQTVKAGSFSPPPNVDSAILHVGDISKKFFKGFSEVDFFEIVRAGFAHKRKMLIGNLKGEFPNIDWQKVFVENNVPLNIRAEDISLDGWKKILTSI